MLLVVAAASLGAGYLCIYELFLTVLVGFSECDRPARGYVAVLGPLAKSNEVAGTV